MVIVNMGISGNMGQTNGNGNPGYKSIINSHCSEYSLISVASSVGGGLVT